MRLPLGKVPSDVLRDTVFKNLGAFREEVVLGSAIGCDGAVLEVGNKSVIVSMDPITGALERLGFEAVVVNANDVATFGVLPLFLFSCILLPEGADSKMVESISVQIGAAAKELGIAIVGGHCETTSKVCSPVVVCCVVGLADKGEYVTAASARAGDLLILTKSAGIEGTAILATDQEAQLSKVLSPEMLQSAKDFYSQLCVVKDALTAFKVGGVHAMHDPTEGGIFNGIHEMADAAKLGVEIFEEDIVVKPETKKICDHFEIDPLQLISSGALLIAIEPNTASKIIETLKHENIYASIIGKFNSTPGKRFLKTKTKKKINLPRPVTDHLWKALSQK
ncbi:MAG: AIR synthase family protein [Nitrososphaerota archaeon]|nr:AIR synthase family protein [Nitrososphaerota archaeon]